MSLSRDTSQLLIDMIYRSVLADYSDEFHILSNRAEVNELEYIIVGRYKRGFKKQIRDITRIQPINTRLFKQHLMLKYLYFAFLLTPSSQSTSASNTPVVSPTIVTATTISSTLIRVSIQM